MVMTATKEKQRQKILLIVLGVVVVVALVVLYFTVWKNGKSIVIDNTLEQEISGGGTQEALASNLSGLEEKLKKVDLSHFTFFSLRNILDAIYIAIIKILAVI